jgi:hypothetical protein
MSALSLTRAYLDQAAKRRVDLLYRLREWRGADLALVLRKSTDLLLGSFRTPLVYSFAH